MRKSALLSVALAFPLLLGARPPEFGLALPPARTALVLEPDTQEVSVEFLLEALARSTGAELALSQDERQALRQQKVKLLHSTEVPAEELYGFVESHLVANGLAFAPVKGGKRPVLAVYTGTSGRGVGLFSPDPVPVSLAELEAASGHPALLVRTLLQVKNLDVRALQTQLRQLLLDPSGLVTVVPVGERGLLIQGRASFTAGLVQQLRELDAAAGRGQPAVLEKIEAQEGAR